jgi:hypothetical protein
MIATTIMISISVKARRRERVDTSLKPTAAGLPLLHGMEEQRQRLWSGERR